MKVYSSKANERQRLDERTNYFEWNFINISIGLVQNEAAQTPAFFWIQQRLYEIT